MRRGLLLAAAALLLAPPGLASGNDRLAEDDGRLLLGTGGVGIGNPNGSLPADAPAELHPVSHATVPFTVECARGVIATVTWSSLTNETLEATEHTLVQVELRDANGTVRASTFGADGETWAGTDGMLEPADYELHIFHMAGEPLRYNATVEGKGSTHC